MCQSVWQLSGTPNHTLGLTEKSRSVPSGVQCDPVDGLQAEHSQAISSVLISSSLTDSSTLHTSMLLLSVKKPKASKANSPNPSGALPFCLQSSNISTTSGLLEMDSRVPLKLNLCPLRPTGTGMHTDVSGHCCGTVRLASPGADLLGCARPSLDIHSQEIPMDCQCWKRTQEFPPSLDIPVPSNIPDAS